MFGEGKTMVSVIMSTRNGSKTLHRAIESILVQTYSDLELIVCDDASTDNTLEILTQYQEKDSRVVIVHNEENMGLSRSLNKCIRISRGEYIARMDDDDWAFPNRFDKQIDFLSHHPTYAFVGCNAITFDGDSDTGENNKPEVPQVKHLIKGSPYLHPSIMFRRESIEQVNGYSEKDYAVRRAQDYELFMRMHAQGLVGYNMQEHLMKYYYNQSVTQKKRSIQTVIDGVKIRYHGYKQMKVKPWKYIYILLPVYVFIKHEIIRLFSKETDH